jgi:hypothetical protein
MIRFYIAFFVLIVWQPISAVAQPKVLAELFRNVGCGNCQQADDEYATYMASNPGIILINYHNSIGTPNDPFYKASFPASSDRSNFYSVPADPTAIIDGYFSGDGSNTESAWQTNTTTSLAYQLPTINSTIGYGPAGIDTFHFTFNGGSSNTEVVYYVAIKESQLYYDNSYDYGKPPGNLWNDVFRSMLPGDNGSAPFFLGGSHTVDTVIYNPANYPFYQGIEQNMTAIIFVQDANAYVSSTSSNNYQVEAIDTIPLAPPASVAETESPTTHLMISSNPLTAQGQIGFELTSAGQVQLTLCDMLGREVHTLVDGEMPAGQTSVEMNSVALPAGCYFARLTVNGMVADNEKFIIAP